MRTKIVYVIVSSEKDIYLEQAYVSMYSLKFYMPDSTVVVLTDRLTSDTFKGTRKKEISLADEVVVVDLPSTLNAQQRSRQLKTSVRNRIEGDFLFVDCDTIITHRLDEIDNLKYSIAACRDTHSSFASNPYRDTCLIQGHRLEWPIDDEHDYFNTGVLYVKDTPEMHDFYHRWNDNLNNGYSKKVWMDQPAFAKTNYEMGHIVQHLDDIWNCELKHGIRYLKDAYIVHYLCTNPSQHQNRQLFILNEKSELLKIKENAVINEDIKKTIIDPFTGLAEVTHCFAGDDLYFFRTIEYRLTRSHYGKKGFSIISSIIHVLLLIEEYTTKIKMRLCKK